MVVYTQIDWILPALTLWRGCGRMVCIKNYFAVFCAQRVRQLRKIRGLDEARLFIFTLKSKSAQRERENFNAGFNEREAHS